MLKINRFRHVRLAIVVLLLSGMFGWSAQNAALAGNTDLWKVVEIKGDAQYNQNGSGWKPLNTGTVLKPGSRVKTGKDGRIVISRPGDTVSVSPNSRFGVPAPARKGPVTHIMQDLGILLFKIKTRPQNPFNIKTPYLAAIIRGTTFTVSVDDSNAALHVATGAVEVHSVLSGETALVRPGETAIIDSRTGGRMKLVGANGRKPVKTKPVKKSNKTGATGSTGKAASAVQKIGNTEAMGSTGKTTGAVQKIRNTEATGDTGKAASAVQKIGDTAATGSTGAPGGGARFALKPTGTHHVISSTIGAGRIDLFKLTKGLVNRAEARRNRSGKKLRHNGAGGSASGTNSFIKSADPNVTSADGAETTAALIDENSDVATVSTTDGTTSTTDSLATTDSTTTTDSVSTTDSLTTTTDSLATTDTTTTTDSVSTTESLTTTGTMDGGGSQDGNSQGGNSQGGNSQGGNSQGGNSQGDNAQGDQQ